MGSAAFLVLAGGIEVALGVPGTSLGPGYHLNFGVGGDVGFLEGDVQRLVLSVDQTPQILQIGVGQVEVSLDESSQRGGPCLCGGFGPATLQ